MEEARVADLAAAAPCPALGAATYLTRDGVGEIRLGSISLYLFRPEERENRRFLAGNEVLQLGRPNAFALAHTEGLTLNGDHTPMGT
jgi:hypothetical protein